MALNFASTAIRLTLVLALVGLWLLLQPAPSHACSCAYPYTPSEALERSAAVFTGTVVSIDGSTDNQTGLSPITVEFDVSTVWKGPVQRTKRMRTPGVNNSCHFPFQEGVEYLVFSLGGSNVDWCSPVRPLSAAADDLAELGQGEAPAEGTTAPTPVVTEQPPPPTPVDPEQPAGGGCGPSPQADGLLVAGLVVGVAWLGLRKRRS